MSRRAPRWAPLALVVAVGLLAVPAAFSAAPSASDPAPVRGVQVDRFVVRDATGTVVSRGATATLPGTTLAPPTQIVPRPETITAVRGRAGLTRSRTPLVTPGPVTATRR